MTETHTAPVAPDLFEKVRGHERSEILEFARREDLLPYFRQVESEAGPVVTMEGSERLMLGSNNYLGLTGDARVKQAAQDALSRYGTALTGSRLMNGTIPLHHELEQEIAAWYETEAALVFTTGYQANLGCLSGILGASDTVVAGSSEHASILDGCKLSGARFRPFKHKRFDRMETMLERAATDGGGVLVVVDGVYSMEGDICDVARVADAAERYGARFMVDEAHSVGVLGERGTGVCELYGIEDRVDLRMGTFSKSLASCGGFIAGSEEVIDYLRIAARPFLFTAAAVPSATAAALEAVRICRSDEGPAAVRQAAGQRRLPAPGPDRAGLQDRRADRDARRPRAALAGRPGRGRRGPADGDALEGALGRGHVHQRRAAPGGRQRRLADPHLGDGDPRARAPRPGAGDLRKSQKAVSGPGGPSMKAISIAEDRSLQTTEIEAPPLAGDEARVEVAFCGICGSDLHMRPSDALPAGTVMGHEFSGTITELGDDVDGFEIGQRVAVFPFASCGECPNCARGDLHVCQQAAMTGLGLGQNHGGFAESVAVKQSMIVPIPDSLSFEHGALVEPLAVALHGIDIAEAEPGDRCVVIGAGPIGVMTALALRARGIDDVLVIERNEHRHQRMRDLGFDVIGLDDVHMKVIEHFGGELPDVVLECAGNPAAPALAIELVRSCGIVALLGVLGEPVEISQLTMIIKEAQLRASFAYTQENFREAIEILAAGKLPADRLITHKAPLDQAQEMFERLENPATEEIKILLYP